MKRIIPGILFTLLWIAWGTLSAQSILRVSGEYQNTPLREVLTDWESQVGVYFSFQKKLIQEYTITQRFEEEPLPQALASLLEDLPLEVEMIDRSFIMIKHNGESRVIGQLLDQNTGEGIAFASIRVGRTTGDLTDSKGHYVCSLNADSRASVIIQHIGYESVTMSLASFMAHQGPILMVPEEVEIQAVTISEYLTDGISHDKRSAMLRPQRVAILPGMTSPDVFQMLQVLPGISSPQETSTGIHLRGGTPDQTLILYNDIPVYQTGHFFDMLSALNPFSIQQAAVFQGGYAAHMTGRVSGIVKLDQGSHVPDSLEAGININLTHLGTDLKIPLKTSSSALFLTLRRSLTDLFPTLTYWRLEDRVFQESRFGWLRDSEFLSINQDTYDFSDGGLKWILTPEDGKHEVLASVFWGFNEFILGAEELEEPRESRDQLSNQSFGAGVQWTYDSGKRYQHQLSLSSSSLLSGYIFEYTDTNTEDFIEQIRVSNSVEDLRAKSAHQLQVNDQLIIRTGYEMIRQQVAYDLFFESPEGNFQEFNEPTAWSHILFGSASYSPSDKLYMEAGLRSTWFSELETWITDPRINAHYNLSRTLTLRGYAGRYHQFISQLLELGLDYLGVSTKVWAISDGEFVPAISSLQWGTGLLWESNGWLINVEAYGKRINHLTSLSPGFTPTQADIYEQGTATINGLEILLKKRWKRHSAWMSYTLSRILYEFEEFSPHPFYAPHDQRHIFRLTHMVTFGNWELSTGWNYRSGKPFTPRTGESVTLEEDDTGTRYWIVTPQFGDIHSSREPAYHRLDISGLHRVRLQGRVLQECMVGGSIVNLYNRRNILSINYLPEYFPENDLPEVPESEEVQKEMIRLQPNLMIRLIF